MQDLDIEDPSINLEKAYLDKKKYTTLVFLSGHLFDQFLINEALNIIEAAGGSFHLVKCQVEQIIDYMSYSELEVGADNKEVLDKIIDSLTSIANPKENDGIVDTKKHLMSLKVGKLEENSIEKGYDMKKRNVVLTLGAGRVCRPAAELLTSIGSNASVHQVLKSCIDTDFVEQNCIEVVVGFLCLKDAEEITEGISNATAVQLDVMNHESLHSHIGQADVVISVLPPSCHNVIATACIELKKHLVTASYVDEPMSKLDEPTKNAGITILGEMVLDPGIDHMMAMKMINQAHAKNGKIRSFTSYCGGLPSPEATNNPLAYKFRLFDVFLWVQAILRE